MRGRESTDTRGGKSRSPSPSPTSQSPGEYGSARQRASAAGGGGGAGGGGSRGLQGPKKAKTARHRAQKGGPEGAPEEQPTHTGFIRFLKSAKYVDCILKVQTTDKQISTFPAHRVVLSQRSPFFDALFSDIEPSETNQNGVPMFDMPVFPAHEALHEALGFNLWYIYSMTDPDRIPIPDCEWGLVLGVHAVSNMFELTQLHDFTARIIGAVLDDPRATPSPQDLYTIFTEATKWAVRDVSKAALERLLALIGRPDAPDAALARSSYDVMATVINSTDPSLTFHILRRWIAVRTAAKMPPAPDQLTTLWARVPFHTLTLQDVESAFAGEDVPVHLVLDAATRLLAQDPRSLDGVSEDLFAAALDHATAPQPQPGDTSVPARSILFTPWSPARTCNLLAAYCAARPDLDEEERFHLWSRAKLDDMSVEELRRIHEANLAPNDMVVGALFRKFKYKT
ncbi:hypothetical protein M427DRAFT_308471 [Gonapodya prolifera JEL478]|uniref:BTB domain-containing protein n=1 Tax=Gonapodya prolifera (strain JEL478) TaxID=1344416 RepID=A0A139AH26_GONPJ|nr:hypothetical protein M427DRAFT_308471 [Gonapodya prolifera JEL478]|eukprot:KXS16060.1 hypothetical protein M427DRAFT_308471 [Gonapodya prolifera JEL478]